VQHARATRIIHAPPATLWPLIADVTAINRWSSAVASVDLLSDEACGLGAARRCNFYDGSSVREDIIELDETKRVRLKLSEFSVPMKRLEAEISLRKIGDDDTEASFEMFYEVKWGIVGLLMGATVVRRMMGKVASGSLAGLNHHATTGETVGKDFVERPA
jgi:ribosome-associated toxin RatA of RatAB toxin-antitoxin module